MPGREDPVKHDILSILGCWSAGWASQLAGWLACWTGLVGRLVGWAGLLADVGQSVLMKAYGQMCKEQSIGVSLGA